MSRIILTLISIFAISTSLEAENIAGRIVDKKGRPLNGAVVMINSNQRTLTTINNSGFKFKDVSVGDTLVIYPTSTYVGRIVISNQKAYDIKYNARVLYVTTSDAKTVEVPCVKVVSNVAKSGVMTKVDIAKSGANDLIELLRGRVAGLQILEKDGGYMAQIRGGTSMNLSSEPLFIIDGTQYNTLSSANGAVSIGDIESVEVLKEGSEYGVRGANGVIIIKTTK